MAGEKEKLVLEIQIEKDSNTDKQLAKLEKEVKLLTERKKELNRAYRNGDKSIEEYSAEMARLNTQLVTARRNLRNTRNEVTGVTSFTDKLTNSVRNAGQSIKTAFVGFFAISKGVDLIGTAIEETIQLAKNMDKLTRQIQRFGDVSEAEATRVAGSIQAISDVFEKDSKEVLTTANTVAKEFNISIAEASKLLQQGFAAGSDSSGKFLDIMKEYPAQLKAVGLSAEQSFAIINQQVEQGVFSDKGVDAIKEAGISLREMTKPAKEAIDGIGLSSDAIQKALADGSKSTFDVIQEISRKLAELPPQSSQVGTAIADIFKGAGEDAGLRYLLTLGNINTEYQNVIDGTDDLGKAQNRLVEAQGKSNALFSAFFDSGDETLTNLGAGLTELSNSAVVTSVGYLARVKLMLSQTAEGLSNVFSSSSKGFKDAFDESFDDVTKKLQEEAKKQKAISERAQRERNDISKKDQEQRSRRAQMLLKNIENLSKGELTILRVTNAKAVEAEEKRRKDTKKEREKLEAERIKAAKKLAEETEKNTEKLLEDVTKLEQEALLASIENKREAEDQKLEITRANKIKEIKDTIATEEAKQAATDAVNKKFDAERLAKQRERKEEDKKESDEKKQEDLKAQEIEREKAEERRREINNATIDLAEQAASSLIEVENRRTQRVKDLELAALDARLEQGLISQADFEKEREAIERKAFNRQKRLEIAEISISLARELAGIAANSAGNPLNAFTGGTAGAIQNRTLAAIAVGRSAVQAGVVASQSFAEGGFTGNGFGFKDHTGHEPAGVVHDNEFVGSKQTLNTPRGMALAQEMDSINRNPSLGYFAEGGFTTQQQNIGFTDLQDQIINGVAEAVGAIKVENVATETNDVAARVQNLQSRGSI